MNLLISCLKREKIRSSAKYIDLRDCGLIRLRGKTIHTFLCRSASAARSDLVEFFFFFDETPTTRGFPLHTAEHGPSEAIVWKLSHLRIELCILKYYFESFNCVSSTVCDISWHFGMLCQNRFYIFTERRRILKTEAHLISERDCSFRLVVEIGLHHLSRP